MINSKSTLLLPLLAMLLLPCGLFGQTSKADTDKIAQALRIKPKQGSVDYDIPSEEDLKNCKLSRANDTYDVPGWIVIDNTSRVIRVFLDRNKDGDLDQWSYYKNGIEVYRDVDDNFDGKTDQYRWLGSGGIRWGVDSDQDGQVNSWKAISAQEVAEEVFYAVKENDRKRFLRLLLTSDELRGLRLGKRMNDVVVKSVNEAGKSFDQLVRNQKQITAKSEFSSFGGSRPGIVPEGREGIEQDITIYDNAQSLFETGSKYNQISLGTLVRVDDKWRILEAPQFLTTSSALTNGGLFYPLPEMGQVAGVTTDSPVDEEMGELFDQYEKLEGQLRDAKEGTVTERLQRQRADLLVEMIASHDREEDKKNWTRQMADTVSSAYQQDLFPNGLDFLEGYLKDRKAKRENVGLDYVAYRVIQARSHKGMQGNSRERAEANDQYMEDLEIYVEQYPQGDFSAEAGMQLGLYYEVSDERDGIDQAIKWYRHVADNFGDSPEAIKANGAVTRLDSIGKSIAYRASTLSGNQTFDLRAYKGKRIVVIHYWATWCDACVEDFDELKRLKAKYKDELSIIGANVDESSDEVKRFLQGKGITWPQVWEEGGIEESPVATQLGVTTLPLTILIDKSGEVIENQISVSDLDRDIQRAIRRGKSANAGTRTNR